MNRRPDRSGGAPTLATVAAAAGVSRQTVSNALNSPELLRPDVTAEEAHEVLVAATPNIGFYAAATLVALLAPQVAAFGYFAIADLYREGDVATPVALHHREGEIHARRDTRGGIDLAAARVEAVGGDLRGGVRAREAIGLVYSREGPIHGADA